jgi:hypothetical protein
MHNGIVGGLMAVGLLAGCGGAEVESTEGALDKAESACNCRTQRVLCLRGAQTAEEQDFCNVQYFECIQAPPPSCLVAE